MLPEEAFLPAMRSCGNCFSFFVFLCLFNCFPYHSFFVFLCLFNCFPYYSFLYSFAYSIVFHIIQFPTFPLLWSYISPVTGPPPHISFSPRYCISFVIHLLSVVLILHFAWGPISYRACLKAEEVKKNFPIGWDMTSEPAWWVHWCVHWNILSGFLWEK